MINNIDTTTPDTDAVRPLEFRLSEANAPLSRHDAEVISRPEARPLDEDATARLLARLPDAPETPPVADSGFALREASLPRPRPGRVVDVPFPPPGSPDDVPQRPAADELNTPAELAIVRYQPEGEVDLAEGVSITFSAPMVALDSVQAAAVAEPPARLNPQPPGQWRWMDPRTLVFVPEAERMPMATEYRVEVPAGTTAANGAVLAETVAFDFATPAPRLISRYPEGNWVRPDSPLLLEFDQAMDPETVLAATSVRVGRRTVALRAATADEVAADAVTARRVAGASEGRSVALKPLAPWPLDSTCSVTLKGVPSLEGPRATTSSEKWKFTTPGPFRVMGLRPGWRTGAVEPGEPWMVELSNPVDAESFDETRVTVEPPVARMTASVAGPYLRIAATAIAGESYRVTLDPALRDLFGQGLERSEPVRVDVGEPTPRLAIPGGDHVILDPDGPPSLAVRTIGLHQIRVQVHTVGPQDWMDWEEGKPERWSDKPVTIPGERVADLVLTVPGGGRAWTDVDVDLSPWLRDGLGQLIVSAEPKDRLSKEDRRRLTAATWVQATRLGVDVITDAATLRAWVTDLSTGAPLEGATATFGATSAISAEDGICALAFSDSSAPVLVVRREDDVTLLPYDYWSGWRRYRHIDDVTCLMFDDRGLYRPGEQVRLKGWLRTLTGGPRGDVESAPPSMTTVEWAAWDSLQNEIGSGTAVLDAFGGFDIAINLSDTVNLGRAWVTVGDSWRHNFRIAEFRRPEYEVTASIEPNRAIAGDTLTASARAVYYAGGPLRNAPVTWSVDKAPAAYSPPGWDRFTFGTGVPWWRTGPRGYDDDYYDDDDRQWGDSSGPDYRTGEDGAHHLAIATTPGSAPRTWSLSAEATVTDVNRQAWTASASVLVHPSAVCVGLRTDRSFVTSVRPVDVETIVVDLDGTPQSDVDLSVRAERREDRQVAGKWQEVVAETVERAAVSGPDALTVSLGELTPGRWTVIVEAADAGNRAHRSSLELWVTGATAVADRRAEADELQLIPDRPSYAGGDIAEVLLLAPFAPAHGVVIVERNGVIRTEPVHITDACHTVRIPIEDVFTPGVHVEVVLAGAAARHDAPAGTTRPAFASGGVRLSVPPAARTLTVGITPRAPGVRPGDDTVLDLMVTGADGLPVAGAGVTVIVVDEAVLAVAGYRKPDPLAVFYPWRGDGVDVARSRPLVLLARPDMLATPDAVALDMAAGTEDGVMPVMARRVSSGPMPSPGSSAGPPPIRMRSDFNALALFAATVTTDADGCAAVPVTLPDNLTRYRVLAVATDGVARFGVGESALTARLPLMVRPSAPRFLSFGDTFELPVVIQNQSDEPLEVEVAVRAGNAQLTAGAGRQLVVPGNDRAEVRFPAAAAAVGQARFEVAAASGPDADAATVTLPVWSPATTEAFALHGVLDDGVVDQPVRAPAGAVPSFGGLEVTTSSTGVAALADAVIYLTNYPFECAEQLASRVLAIAALRDVLAAFGTEGQASPAELEAAVRRDLETLAARQCRDGGFGWWTRTDESWPYISVHVGNALARARAKGFEVPEAVTQGLLRYLTTIGKRFPRHYPADARAAIEAYAIAVRAALGDPDPAAARELLSRRGKSVLSVEGLAWLLPVLTDARSRREAKEVRRQIANRIVETPGAASVAVRYEDGAHLLLASDRRADAIVLEALIADQPDSDLIPKLVAGLLGHRTAGRWGSTQENAFVLLALGRYFDTYESVTPDFTARLWLGEDFAGEQGFHGRSTDVRNLAVPMAALAGERSDLLLAKDGPGRLYYRLGLRYAPADLALDPLDRGFEVSRTYEALDNPADVRRDDDGTWHVRAGARVRVSVTMTARARRYHVALVDPLPAGFEPLDPSLATTASDAETDGSEVGVIGGPGLGGPGRGTGHWWWWIRPWFDHENLRDERAEAFTTLLWEGTYHYRYTARATTPGVFSAAPPKAEEMYSPEVFGRGGTDRVVVA